MHRLYLQIRQKFSFFFLFAWSSLFYFVCSEYPETGIEEDVTEAVKNPKQMAAQLSESLKEDPAAVAAKAAAGVSQSVNLEMLE